LNYKLDKDFKMDDRHMFYVLGIVMMSTIIANILIQNYLINFLILIIALIISFYIGLFVESKFKFLNKIYLVYNIYFFVNKIKNFDFKKKINSLLSNEREDNNQQISDNKFSNLLIIIFFIYLIVFF